ncbi:MAG: glycoside hydrolase family 57 protein [Spirochaetota bacterium]
MALGSVGLVLHAHLPFVRHPEYERFLEEDWLYEAISETYLPLLRVLHKLRREGVSYQITLSLSPTLCAMLADKLLQNRYKDHLQRLIELGQKELERTKDIPREHELAAFYLQRYQQNYDDFTNVYRDNLLQGFRSLEESGHVVILTTAATHAFLPLYKETPEAVQAQVELALMSHVAHFRKKPRGFWLPECGYYPGLEKVLKYNNIDYFYGATHSINLAKEKAERGVFAPAACPNGVHVFARDFGLSQLVWSADHGYPVDGSYRDFYRDIGYDLDIEYVRPYIHEPDVRVFTGYKYWAITDIQTDNKQYYDREKALERVQEHAGNFIYNIKKKAERLEGVLDREPHFSLPFDAELFGHWWFEGIEWLEAVLRGISEDPDIELMQEEEYLDKHPKNQEIHPSLSSWGSEGYASVFLDGSNDWIYRHVHRAIDRMIELVKRFPDQTSLKERFLQHAVREVLLAMASDWPFIISNGTSVVYAERRMKEHIYNFNLVYENMCRNSVDTEWLTRTEKRTNIFPDIDYRVFSDDF